MKYVTARDNPRIAAKLANLPASPGVYLMRDKKGEVFYIGKAKSLRERVRGYFSGSDTRAFVALLDRLLADLEVVLTHSEKEALLVENELIKAHQPRFNVKLTDDKRFLCLRLDLSQAYPRLQIVRRFGRDKAKYFGPYHSASAIRETLRLINRHFQLRTCTDQVMRNRARPCLQYQIKRCPAPCVFDLSDGRYADNVRDVIAFLEGRKDELVTTLTERMERYAQQEAFEAAAALRDQIRAITRSLERQRLVTSDFVNRDVIGLYREGPSVEVHVMRTRNGRLIDARRYGFSDLEQPSSDVLSDFLARYYTREADLPDELLLPEDTDWSEALSLVLTERRGAAVKAQVPKRGDKRRLIELANRNAKQAFVDQQRERGAAKTALERLQRALHLRNLPQRIECIDISHLMGTHIVASQVALQGGVPNKAGYRHYKIRSLQNQDDFKSMYEVVSRRAKRGLAHNDLPNLLVIDGGKGQLAAARAALKDHGIDEMDLVGLAKSRLLGDAGDERTNKRKKTKLAPHGRLDGATLQRSPQVDAILPAAADSQSESQAVPDDADTIALDDEATTLIEAAPQSPQGGTALRSSERVFVEGHKNAVVLRQNSAELFVLVRARDEAHRFAITFHRKLRSKAQLRSKLDDIVGLGPRRKQALLKHFGSVSRITAASAAELGEVIGKKLAASIYEQLRANATPEPSGASNAD